MRCSGHNNNNIVTHLHSSGKTSFKGIDWVDTHSDNGHRGDLITRLSTMSLFDRSNRTGSNEPIHDLNHEFNKNRVTYLQTQSIVILKHTGMVKSIKQTSNIGTPRLANISGETALDTTFEVGFELDFVPVDTVA